MSGVNIGVQAEAQKAMIIVLYRFVTNTIHTRMKGYTVLTDK
jgi:hypothetical protein